MTFLNAVLLMQGQTLRFGFTYLCPLLQIDTGEELLKARSLSSSSYMLSMKISLKKLLQSNSLSEIRRQEL